MISKGVALITPSVGASGRATALQLANDGFDIALSADRSQQAELSQLQREVQSKGFRCEFFVSDLLEEESIKSLIDAVVRDLGGLDVLFFNTFDISICPKSLTTTTAEDWDKTFIMNTRPVFLCYKYAAEKMIDQGRGGRLIARMPLSVKQALFMNASAVTASLFAVRGLSQTAALELGPHNITVNIVSHGPMDVTEGIYNQVAKAYSQSQHLIKYPSDDFHLEMISKGTPLVQKTASGQDIARVVGLLASKDCNFMTGQTVSVNGGITM